MFRIILYNFMENRSLTVEIKSRHKVFTNSGELLKLLSAMKIAFYLTVGFKSS